MADNIQTYGIRWHSSKSGSGKPNVVRCAIASAYQGAVNGGGNVGVGIGDPIRRVATGTYELSAGNEAAGNAAEVIYAVVCGVDQYHDGTTLQKGAKVVPYNTTYSNIENQSVCLAIPVEGNYFEIDCDDLATATTYSAYRAFIGEQCDHRFSGTSSRATPRLDISTHLTASGQWRIVDVITGPTNRHFDGLYVKLLVECFEPQTAGV